MASFIFRKSLVLEKEVDDYLDKVSESALTFKQGVCAYLEKNPENFDDQIKKITKKEHQADDLCRNIERELYLQTLIPSSRGDVLELMENLDRLLGYCKGVMWRFEIETPFCPEEFHKGFILLLDSVVLCVEAVVLSCRAFFRNAGAMADHMHKVSYHETEADKSRSRLVRNIYQKEDLDLSQKMHLSSFVDSIDKIADVAEDVSDRLAIYSIKRSI